MMRRFLVASCAVVGLVGVSACLSPTLPLPPPETPDAVGASVDAGVWEVRGSCTPGATVLIRNVNTGVISGTEDKNNDGRYFIRVDAEACDGAEVFEIVDTTTSDASFFLIEPTTNGVGDGSCG
jgi:hypothetical protein